MMRDLLRYFNLVTFKLALQWRKLCNSFFPISPFSFLSVFPFLFVFLRVSVCVLSARKCHLSTMPNGAGGWRGKGFKWILGFRMGILCFPSFPDFLLLSVVPVPAAVQPRFSLVFSSFFSPF